MKCILLLMLTTGCVTTDKQVSFNNCSGVLNQCPNSSDFCEITIICNNLDNK